MKGEIKYLKRDVNELMENQEPDRKVLDEETDETTEVATAVQSIGFPEKNPGQGKPPKDETEISNKIFRAVHACYPRFSEDPIPESEEERNKRWFSNK
jgi:hypothetical protein